MSEPTGRYDAPFSAFADCRSRPNPSFADALRHAIKHGLPQAPLFRGGADGRHSLGFLGDGGAPWPRRIDKSRAPAVVVIGDDAWPKRLSAGPDGWRCAGAARAWARYAVVHAAAGAESHYFAISEAARHHHHVLCVETSSAFLEAWLAFLGPGTACFRAPIDRRHPIIATGILH